MGARDLGKTLVNSNPVSRTISGTLSALGIGHTRNARGENLTKLKKAIARGDVAEIQRRAANSKWAKIRGIAAQALNLGTTDYQAAKTAYNYAKGKPQWPASSGAAGGAAPNNSPETWTWTPPASAPAAPRPKPPCAYGPRDPQTGYCPKRPRATSSGQSTTGSGIASQPRASRPCAYGPRDPQTGLCPKRPRRATTTTAVERARDRAITAGGTAAANAAKSILKTVGAGQVVRVIAKASLVGLAGVAAYALTRKLMELRYRTYPELKAAAAIAYKQARREQGEDAAAGIFLPKEVGDQLAAYFRSRLRLLAAHEAAGDPISGMVNLTFED